MGDHIKEVSGRYEGDTGGEEGGQQGCGVVCSHHVTRTHTGVHVYMNCYSMVVVFSDLVMSEVCRCTCVHKLLLEILYNPQLLTVRQCCGNGN